MKYIVCKVKTSIPDRVIEYGGGVYDGDYCVIPLDDYSDIHCEDLSLDLIIFKTKPMLNDETQSYFHIRREEVELVNNDKELIWVFRFIKQLSTTAQSIEKCEVAKETLALLLNDYDLQIEETE